MQRVEPLDEIRAHIETMYGGNQGAFAKSIGFSQAYISDVVNAKRPPSDRLLAILGLSRVVVKS